MKALAIGDAFLPVAAAGIVFAIGSMPSFSTTCILFSNISAILSLGYTGPIIMAATTRSFRSAAKFAATILWVVVSTYSH